MKTIKLTNGMKVKVGDRDYKALNKLTFYAIKSGNTYYASHTDINNRSVFMHTMILFRMGKAVNGQETHHKDHDGLNNQRGNLVSCTTSNNLANREKFTSYNGKKCSSSYKGVCWDSSAKKWRSQLRFNKQLVYLGNYDTEIEAAVCYNNEARKCFKQFALLNTQPEIVKLEKRLLTLSKSLGTTYYDNLKKQLNGEK